MTARVDSLHKLAMSRLREIDLCGVASVEEGRGTPLYDSANALLPGARSVVVVGVELFPEVVNLVTPGRQAGMAMLGDLYNPHVDFLHSRLHRALYDLAGTYRNVGYRALPLPSKDTPFDRRFLKGVLSFKHAAEFAGLGRIGRSSLLITPQFGPRVRLACLVTDAPLPAVQKVEQDPCESCPGPCIEQCPSKALAEPSDGVTYAINKFACSVFRGESGACINCLKVCPAGSR